MTEEEKLKETLDKLEYTLNDIREDYDEYLKNIKEKRIIN